MPQGWCDASLDSFCALDVSDARVETKKRTPRSIQKEKDARPWRIP
jgi:hypothetical protein